MTDIWRQGSGRLHFIGIGGTGMSALARLLGAKGYTITGSDRGESVFTRQLESEGVRVDIGHKAENVDGADAVVYSAAIKPDNVERARARELGIPEIERSVALGKLSERYGRVAAIAGCHGKTTITSMLALISKTAGLDATVHVGGYVNFMNGGAMLGGDGLFITEACEYVESFMQLKPDIALINNIDDDHLDYYRDIEHIYDTFVRFTQLLPEDGVVVGCTDDFRVKKLLDENPKRVITYGVNGGDYTAGNIRVEDGKTLFDVLYKGEKLFEAVLNVPGKHNVINALGATAVARELGADIKDIAESLEKYTLTQRRFEYYGELGNGSKAKVYHDYAHHPSEIAACLEGAASVCKGRLFVVFQCNSYTRAKTLFCTDHVSCFKNAFRVFVPDIYPGREVDTGMVHARDMVNSINAVSGNAQYIATFEEIRGALFEQCREGDIIVTLGSGNVNEQTKKFL